MGRQFLRLLDAHAAVEDWQRLADTLPPHCAGLMAGLASECAGNWALLAAHLDRRQLAERA
ncbi:hypothetical protein ALI22I_05900 [Saccharothrix sp. ALI-22-I]|uniref:hypothetical protein n=1 Tax=Saccharothrix sp. ALI-22-I TaxID=1933778 RepID=UPI00097BC07B|nr:hypothetical protein [Saccharothrix sp. ALI-22-I]ONI92133.1 hypothetical protein ALI22I_05900 [Saccharothrix sp. ALI-22-I]